VCDKGGDQVLFFCIDEKTKKLVVCPGSPVSSEPGSAPRYSAFHPMLPYLIYNKENKPIVTVLRYDETGKAAPVCTVDALPPEIPDPKHLSQSDVVIGKSGKFVYDLLRISEVISVFAFDEKTGELNLIQTVPAVSEGPRGCAISPDGRFLIVAALIAHKVEAYPIGEDGKLGTPSVLAEPVTPGTVVFYKP
jgi:6-phosphogluconolactonase (cycloisomerase 2 family)